MDILMFLVKLIVGVTLFTVALAFLIIVFEIPPMLMAFTVGPMAPELAQVYTMLEIALIISILIFGLPKGRKWFDRQWKQWTQKIHKPGA
ncbi:MAG: hypothetical protein L0Y56_21260 [Nitrospira sp.]|nr:hypothetical protein [Nitrospira sp.]